MEMTDVALAQAIADYQHARDTLQRHHSAKELRTKQAAVGKYFRHTQSYPDADPPATWPVYVVAVNVDVEGHLCGWHFQHTPSGQMELAPEADIQPGFLAEECVEVPRNEFVAAFNEVLTAMARFSTRMPM